MEAAAERQLFQLFVAVLVFHSSEFLLAWFIHGREHVSVRSLLISKSYAIAMLCGILEHLIESSLVPGWKEVLWISNAGVALILLGETIRKLAILTGWHAFTHDIRIRPRENHRLVTHGVYRFVRHPGYTGFFVWSVGTQVMLCNPICTIAYAIVTWRFFSQRIEYEERTLRFLFGVQYDEYAQTVPSGIPFVR